MPAIKGRQTIVCRGIEWIEKRGEARRKSRRTLRSAVVLRPRQRIAALELQAMRQTPISLQHQRVVLGRDAVADLENIAESGIWSGAARVIREIPNLASKWTIDNVYAASCGWRRQVGINKSR